MGGWTWLCGALVVIAVDDVLVAQSAEEKADLLMSAHSGWSEIL